MLLQLVHLVVLLVPIRAITNNADLTWFDEEGHPQNYFARQPIPEGLLKTHKIVVNQKFPVLWEVKFAFFDNLEALLIDNCGVNEMRPNAFKDLKPLTDLSLTFNNVKDVKIGVFNFVEVKNLNLSHNRISTIAVGAFDNMPVLEKVVLDFNEVKQWSGDWFFNCSRLGMVSITHNFLEELPSKAFKNFWREEEYVSVYFSFNKIRRVDREAFEGSGKFRDLFLDWNELPRADGHVFGKITWVEHLNLNGDSLRCLSEEFLSTVLNKTKLVSVLENPLKCECVKELRKREGEIEARVEYSQQQTVDC